MPEIKRKNPTQARAQLTVGIILDAAAQILQSEGEAHFNTNRVAEKAGFSIGTLYQYFPNKNSIIEAIAERERIAIEMSIQRALLEGWPHTIEEFLRIIIRQIINAFGRRQKLRRFIIIQMIRLDLFMPVLKEVDRISETVSVLLQKNQSDDYLPLSKTRLFILTRSIMGVIRAAIIENNTALGAQEFEDELVMLALNYLTPTKKPGY
jgi:AcrR family transcriptional regulator